MPSTLAIDFGSRNIGIALLEHASDVPNRVLYAATIVVNAKPLSSAVQPRAMSRRMRRTRKTHSRRLHRLAQALHGIPGAEQIVRFCRRRGYSHEPEDADEGTRALSYSRADFFAALRKEIQQVIPPQHQDQVLRACSKHLNESRRRDAELRPARFENRGPTKCQWEGCRRNVARAGNNAKGRLQQALYAWLKPVFDASENSQLLRRSVDHWIAELDALACWYGKTGGLDEPAMREERKKINQRKNRVYKNLRQRLLKESSEDVAEQFKENWGKTYSRNLTDIVHGGQAGRVRYCREHSDRFVDYFLAGKQIPNRTEVFESDLFGRTQQILFRRIWRLVECRLLPLAGGHIDRVVVERVAFDVLAGKAKIRREISEDKAAEMYWYGPQYGFSSRREMLKKEFDGRCAYCGQQNAIHEVEHLLPRSQFPFDSYFNILPACSTCNSQKGARTAFAARMSVHQDAYQAYSDYVGRLKPPHLFHTIKKGMLKLLASSGNSAEVEKQLGMLANNLVTISATQRGPRPMARFLASRLERLAQQPCKASWTSGRHTALYRSILLPEYRKDEQKEQGDLVNHAVDAIILGCELPSAAAIENPRWYARAQDLVAWREKVQSNGPILANGLPQVKPIQFIPFFEEALGDGYCAIDLSAFNWNRSRQSGHKLDPVGATAGGRPIKREPATGVLTNLKDVGCRGDQIKQVAHPALRAFLEADPEHAPEHLVRWLQQTVKAGLAAGGMGNHPSDQARKRFLTEFVNSPVEEYLTEDAEKRKDIPRTIGIRCVSAGAAGIFDVTRCDHAGKVYQRYKADPRLRALYVGYRVRNGKLDRSKPIQLCVNQVYAVTERSSSYEVPVNVPAGSPLHGRPLGSNGSLKKFLADWQQAFDDFCHQARIAKRFCITQGCVIEKTDGTRFQLRNFSREKPWMKGSPFRDIRRIYRSPFCFLNRAANARQGDALDASP